MKNSFLKDTRDFERFNANLQMRVPILVSYLLLMSMLKGIFGIPFPDITFFLVSFMLLSSLTLAFYFDRFPRFREAVLNVYFLYTIFDLIVLSIIIYYLGGVTWVGSIFYSFYLIANFMTFTRTQALFLTTWIIFIYLFLVFFQYSQIFPPFSLFLPGTQTPFNFNYIFATVVTFISTFILVAYYSQGFYQLYSRKILELQRAEEVLEKESASLETRVEYRKKELEKERMGLRVKIEERKKELEKEEWILQERATELEKFQRIALGREKRLKELQKELNILKQKPNL